MQAGTTFRNEYLTQELELDPNDPVPEEIMVLDESITRYIKLSAELHEVPRYLFYEWRGILMEKLKKRYDVVAKERQDQADKWQHVTINSKKYLKKFRHEYAIITGDKAKNTYCVVCKPWISKQIVKETQHTKTYTVSNLAEHVIISEDHEFLRKEGLGTITMTEKETWNVELQGQLPPKHTWMHERIPTFGM